MPELSSAPADASVTGTDKLLTLAFESVTVQEVANAPESQGSNLASAATVDLSTATGPFIHITGTTTITALGTMQAGAERVVVFDGALTLTHNATSLILPTAANITTEAGDVAVFRSEGSGNWRCTSYLRADGEPLAGGGGGGGIVSIVAGTGIDVDDTDPENPIVSATGGGGTDRSSVNVLSIASGVVDIDCDLGDYFTLSLTANVTSITFSNLPGSGQACSLAIRIRQDGTGSRTVALPSSFKATGGSDTAVQSAANAYTLLTITTFDQGTRWEYAMQEIAA